MANEHTVVASQARYRSGVVEYVVLADNASYPIQEGDLVYQVAGVAFPASRLADLGSATLNKTALAAAFVGVACSKDGLQTDETSFKLTTRKGYVLIATTGDFEFPCAATSWVTGDLVSGVEQSSSEDPNGVGGTNLCDQKVAKTTFEYETIGIANVPYNAIGGSLTSIVVKLRSQLMKADVGSGQ